MEADKNLTTTLGLTQEKIALLLGVTRTQWSLYDGGGRRLPVAALEKLAELLALVKDADTAKLSNSRQKEEQEQHQLQLQKMLRENSYQQEALSRKIKSLEKKYHTNLRAIQWLQQGIAKEKREPGDERTLIEIYYNQTSSSLEKNSWSKLVQYQIKLKVLQEEERLFREQIEK